MGRWVPLLGHFAPLFLKMGGKWPSKVREIYGCRDYTTTWVTLYRYSSDFIGVLKNERQTKYRFIVTDQEIGQKYYLKP